MSLDQKICKKAVYFCSKRKVLLIYYYLLICWKTIPLIGNHDQKLEKLTKNWIKFWFGVPKILYIPRECWKIQYKYSFFLLDINGSLIEEYIWNANWNVAEFSDRKCNDIDMWGFEDNCFHGNANFLLGLYFWLPTKCIF